MDLLNIFGNLTNVSANQQANAASAMIAAIVTLGIIAIIFLIILMIAVYVYISIALMSIAKKTKTKNAWMAWVPILNFYLLTQIAKQSGWWTLILLAWAIPFGGIAILAVGIWMFWLIAERRNLPGWISLLMIIPIVNLVILGIIAWKKK